MPLAGRPIRRPDRKRGLLALLLVCAAGAVADEPLYWARHDLAIPYRWSGVAGGSQVVLYYSTDQGRSWRQAGSALPHVQSFRFQAPGDGEYWFAIRTYDAEGRATPAGPPGPEMRVIVDTAAPRVDSLTATLNEGELTVELTANDQGGVAPQATHVYAQVEGQPGWTPIAVSASPATTVANSVRLSGRWQAPPATRGVTVRATVQDVAGNRTEESATGRRVAVAPLRPSSSVGRVAGWPGQTATPSLDPFAAAERRHTPIGTPRPIASAPDPISRDQRAPETTAWPREQRASQPLIAANRPALPPLSDSPFNSASFRAGGSEPFLGDDLSTGPAAERAPLGPPSSPGFRRPPERLVNSAEFEFDYELERTGRWGVAKVELWGTDNGGRSWRRFAVDSDRQSPIHVTTPGEGEYGFRLVVESVGGLEATTPRPGDEPEALVGVDLSLPHVTLGDAKQGVGYFADQLQIEWRASDEHLSRAPIDLFYSNRATGPWIPIATNLPNSGRHSWRLQRHLPRRMHLRVEARDEAGNVGAATTAEALVIDLATASGSLRSVRPSGG